jgi:large subunit ribosomal protein L29
MKPSELREFKADELQDKLDDMRKRLFSIRSQSVTEKIEDSCARRNIRRDIARIKTIIKENELKG